MRPTQLLGALILLASVASAPAYATCGYSLSSLSNGTTADATPVMGNFNYILNCPNFTGPVGMGTVDPGGKLELAGSAQSVSQYITAYSDTASHRGILNFRKSANNTIGSLTPNANGDLLAQILFWGVTTSGTWNDDAAGILVRQFGAAGSTRVGGSIGIFTGDGTSGSAEHLTILGNGKVGIGTDSPAFGIDVETATGNTPAKFGNARPIYLINDSPIVGFNLLFNGGWVFGKGSSSSYGGAIVYATSTGNMDFYTSNSAGNAGATAAVTSRMTLTQSGSLGVGRTNPGQKLDVNGTIRQSNCTTAGTLSTNASGDIICTSDARLKNIIGDYADGLKAISQITPKQFTYKPTPTNPVETFVHAGFIAQDVRRAIPQAVAVQRTGYLSLDTTAILAASVNAIKELKAANDRQSTRIAQLENKIIALQRKAKMQIANN